MELFDIAFDKTSLTNSLIFNIMPVSEFKNVREFKEKKPDLYKQWELIAKVKYRYDTSGYEEGDIESLNDIYRDKAVFYPEFSKIACITYAEPKSNDNKIVRNMKRIVSNNELDIIKEFQIKLMQLSIDGINSQPSPQFPILCGHNIINSDIPLFIKRLINYRNTYENKYNLLPYILKHVLKSKPWDNIIFDVINVWKFNGVSNSPLNTISDFMGLKRNIEIKEMNDISKYYWSNIENNEEETLKEIEVQSANKVNLVIQFMNEFKSL